MFVTRILVNLFIYSIDDSILIRESKLYKENFLHSQIFYNLIKKTKYIWMYCFFIFLKITKLKIRMFYYLKIVSLRDKFHEDLNI